MSWSGAEIKAYSRFYYWDHTILHKVAHVLADDGKLLPRQLQSVASCMMLYRMSGEMRPNE